MTKREAFEIGYKQLAVDYNASPEDFIRPGITFTTPAQNPGRRAYSSKMPFFELVTVGHAAVIMADESLRPELDRWVKGVEHPHWLLELPRLLHLSEILAPYGYKLTQTFHHYLPTRDFKPAAAPKGLTLKLLEREDIASYYPNEAWPNALQGQENPAGHTGPAGDGWQDPCRHGRSQRRQPSYVADRHRRAPRVPGQGAGRPAGAGPLP